MFGIPEYLIWLGIVVVLAAVESMTMDLNCIWFAAGALCSFLLSFTGIGWIAQLIVFAIVSGVCLTLVRPIALKHLNIRRTATNADRVIGNTGMVVETIDNDVPSGQVKANGQIWTARSADGSIIPEGEHIKVCRIEGVKLIVETVKEAVL